MKPEGSLYGLKDAAKISFRLISKKFKEAGLQEVESAPCVFRNDCVIVVCYVDDILVFANAEEDISVLEHKLKRDLIINDFGMPA